MKSKSISLKRGDCILTEEPFVYTLSSRFRKERCDNCLKSFDKLSKCSGCNYVHYCSLDCQKESWTEHKPECTNLRNIHYDHVPDSARMLAKIIRKLKNGGDMQRGYYSKHGYRKFRDLMSHYQEIKSDDRRLEHLESLTVVLKSLLFPNLVPNENELMQIYGRLCTNAFSISDSELNSIGTGIYLGVSIMDHSCNPNAAATFEGKTISIRLLEDVPCLDYSKIFITYIELMDTSDERRKTLKDSYYFWCTCSKCVDSKEQDEMLAAQCPNQKCDQFLTILDDGMTRECKKCGQNISNEHIDEFKLVMELTKEKLAEMKNVNYVDILQLCLKKQENVLHPMNIYHLKTLDASFESSITLNKWEHALDCGSRLLPGFRKYCGGFNPIFGGILLKIGKLELHLNKPVNALQHLREAATILKVTHGERHSLYTEQLIPLLHEALMLNK